MVRENSSDQRRVLEAIGQGEGVKKMVGGDVCERTVVEEPRVIICEGFESLLKPLRESDDRGRNQAYMETRSNI